MSGEDPVTCDGYATFDDACGPITCSLPLCHDGDHELRGSRTGGVLRSWPNRDDTIRALHAPVTEFPGYEPFPNPCRECDKPHPCPTIRALNGEPT